MKAIMCIFTGSLPADWKFPTSVTFLESSGKKHSIFIHMFSYDALFRRYRVGNMGMGCSVLFMTDFSIKAVEGKIKI
jgi:hypothetical protein